MEVELGDGLRLPLRALSSEPGYGFLTLVVHSAEGEPEELIVPVGAIRLISLGPADEARRPGFALPLQEKGPGTAAWVPALEMSAPAAVLGLTLPQYRVLGQVVRAGACMSPGAYSSPFGWFIRVVHFTCRGSAESSSALNPEYQEDREGPQLTSSDRRSRRPALRPPSSSGL